MNIEDITPDEPAPEGEPTPEAEPTPEGGSAEPTSPADRRPLGFWLRTVDGLLTEQFDAAFAAEGVTRRDWMLLTLLSGEVDAAAAGRLARKGKHLRKLEDRGWAEEQGDGTWALTDQGRAAKEQLATVVDGIRARVAGAVSPEDFATTMTSLEAIATELGWDAEWMPSFGPRGFGPGRRGFGRGFGPGFRPGFQPGFGPGFHPGFRPGFEPGSAHNAHRGFPGSVPGAGPDAHRGQGPDLADDADGAHHGCHGHAEHHAHSHEHYGHEHHSHEHHSHEHHGHEHHGHEHHAHEHHGHEHHAHEHRGHEHHGHQHHGRHGGRSRRLAAEQAYERGFDAGYERGREAQGA